MQTIRFSAALAAALASIVGFASTSLGQAPGGQVPGLGQPGPNMNPGAARPTSAPVTGGLGLNGIAVVDVVYIFKTYPKFKQQMDTMKSKVENAEAEIRKDQEELRRLAEQMKSFQPGTDGYKRAEEAAMRKQGEMQLKVSMQKKQFFEDEGKIYFSISREIDDAVKVIATKNNLALVMKFNGDVPDPNDRNQILQGIQKSIVYYHPQLDITPYVLQELQRGGGVPQVGGNVGRPVPRQ